MKCKKPLAKCEKDAAVFNANDDGVNPGVQACLEHAVDLDATLDHLNSTRGGPGQKPRFPDYNWRPISEYPEEGAA